MAGMAASAAATASLLRRQEHRHQENRPQSVPTRPREEEGVQPSHEVVNAALRVRAFCVVLVGYVAAAL